MDEIFKEMDKELAKFLYGKGFSQEFIEIFEIAGFLKRKKDGIEINLEAIKEFLMLPEV
ncbi:MAG: hypothetical protein QFX40_07630 [Archaeoglobales archaeon]|nr:hypothetical protein [Archaeoglobales archaeon]